MPVVPPIVPVPSPAAAPLTLSLPGGLRVSGVPTQVGATSLTQALALVGAAGPAMAPLAPAFTLIDAMLSVKDFAQAVPELIVNPGAVVEAGVKLAQKIGKLASLVPQLSVPVMVADVLDAVILLLRGLADELRGISAEEARIESVVAVASTLPPGAREALLQVVASARAATGVRRADVQTALAGAGPLLGIVNAFVGLLGLPGVELELDASSGSAADAVTALEAAVDILRAFRRSLPL